MKRRREEDFFVVSEVRMDLPEEGWNFLSVDQIFAVGMLYCDRRGFFSD